MHYFDRSDNKIPETEQSSHFLFASMFTVKKWFRTRVGLAVVQPSNKNQF